MTTADLAKIDTLIAALQHAGFVTAADQLHQAVHQTTYASPVEMFGEIALAVRAVTHLVGTDSAPAVAAALAQAREEIAKVVPDARC